MSMHRCSWGCPVARLNGGTGIRQARGAKMLRSRLLLQAIPAAIALAMLIGCAGDGRQDRRMQPESTGQSTRMAGMYEYLADAGWFTDCTSGKRAPVAMEADNAALERAYLGVREEPGAAVLVTLEGRIAGRPPMEGEGTREHLIVERFDQVWPGESCEKSAVATPLENTYWKLVALNGTRVETHADQREIRVRRRKPTGCPHRRPVPSSWRCACTHHAKAYGVAAGCRRRSSTWIERLATREEKP